MLDIPNGFERQNFEKAAWKLARPLFEEFVEHENLDSDVLNQFDAFALNSIESYTAPSL